ncbi:MAG: SH3 domain-containing protein [Saprospiraceae bacterium]|nr:SH3 domain-containing protein [Saprospiraceae bacterium]
MTAKRLYFILLIVTSLLQSCANDNKKTAQQSSPLTTDALPPQEPTASAEPAIAETQENKESHIRKSLEQLRENKTNRIGSVPTGKDAELNTTIPAPPTKVEGKRVERPGPPGYITQKDATLQAEPSQSAAKIATLKQYETIYILETKMTDESGRAYDIPQWYKIQCADGKKGWLKSQFVGLPF